MALVALALSALSALVPHGLVLRADHLEKDLVADVVAPVGVGVLVLLLLRGGLLWRVGSGLGLLGLGSGQPVRLLVDKGGGACGRLVVVFRGEGRWRPGGVVACPAGGPVLVRTSDQVRGAVSK